MGLLKSSAPGSRLHGSGSRFCHAVLCRQRLEQLLEEYRDECIGEVCSFLYISILGSIRILTCLFFPVFMANDLLSH